jgi:hypothetical protein
MSAAERLVTNSPARMESHASARAHTRPYCALQQLDAEGRPMCDSLQDEEGGPLLDSAPQAFRLYLEFVHAHGMAKGQITTFSNACTFSGLMDASDGRSGARSK